MFCGLGKKEGGRNLQPPLGNPGCQFSTSKLVFAFAEEPVNQSLFG
jgi:hypothetical protein